MLFLIGCAPNENPTEKLGYAFIRQHGAPKSSANIMNDSQVRWNVGSMLATVLVSCGDLAAQKSWLKPCATSTVNA